MGFEFESFI